MASGKNMPTYPRINYFGGMLIGDGMNQRNPALTQNPINNPKEIAIGHSTHMLKHTYRNNAIVAACKLPVILQLKIDLIL